MCGSKTVYISPLELGVLLMETSNQRKLVMEGKQTEKQMEKNLRPMRKAILAGARLRNEVSRHCVSSSKARRYFS